MQTLTATETASLASVPAAALPAGAGPDTCCCEDARQDLCRFAVGVPTALPVAELARHAHRCEACRRYVDDIARVRAWLERTTREPVARVADATALVQRARAALARELAARLARDLRDLGAGQPARPVPLRRQDLRRLVALCGPEPLRQDPWPSAVRLLVRAHLREGAGRRGTSPGRALALSLAARLDPVGLDVALSHIAWLEHTGRRTTADEEADRLLGLMA